MAKDAALEDKWKQRIEEYRQSGLSIRDLSEIAVKPVAIIRKNSLFSDSLQGAEASAIVFNIINTAAANKLDTYRYPEYIFCKLPNIDFTSDNSVLYEFANLLMRLMLDMIFEVFKYI